MLTLSRRQFLSRFAALACGAIGAELLAACTPPTPTPTPLPPTPTFVAKYARPEIVKFYPEAPTKIVHTRHTGVWANGALVPEALRQMLDSSITALTGLADARTAWAALFRPNERIGIKVNTILGSSGWTHVPLVMAVAQSLQDAGIPAEQILVWDRDGYELHNAGFRINEDGPGVRCRGTDQKYTPGWRVIGRATKLSNILLECDALINMPILKQHMYAGISFAMKNHYGTFSNPDLFHGSLTADAIPELNALAPIRSLSRLIVGDVLKVVLGDNWEQFVPGDSIFMSYDPVATDATALRLWSEVGKANGKEPEAYIAKANAWLSGAAKLGLGTNEEKNMQIVELALQ